MLPGKLHQTTSIPGANFRIALVAAQYNGSWVDRMLDYTLTELTKAGIRKSKVVRVPGSYEIPVVAAKLARSRKYHSIIALGIVLQGKTSHAEHITLSSTFHLQKISVETGIPIVHQILTPRSSRDALVRLKIRGIEAAQTAIRMAETMKEI